METLSPNEDLREWVDNAIQEADVLAFESLSKILEFIREDEKRQSPQIIK